MPYFPLLFLLICVLRRNYWHSSLSLAMAASKEELISQVQNALKSHQSGDISNALLGILFCAHSFTHSCSCTLPNRISVSFE